MWTSTDPTYLEFRYMRVFADVTATLPDGPLDTLHIGGAGLTFPRYLGAVRPATTSTVLEIDGQLAQIAEAELGYEPGPTDRGGGWRRPAVGPGSCPTTGSTSSSAMPSTV